MQRELLLRRKAECLVTQARWLQSKQPLLKQYRRNPDAPDVSDVDVRLVVCEKQQEHDLWRAVKLQFWSMPPNEYVGRRKRILVFDHDHLLGIIGVASCIWGLSARDQWIGWNRQHKESGKINYVLDVYVLGAIPPYNARFRGSKLIAMILASEDFRRMWSSRYGGQEPVILMTTSLFGHSAVLNRTRFEGRKLWQRIGYTQGQGTMHFSKETYDTARELLDTMEIEVSNRFGDGPNWKLRLMKTALKVAGLDVEKSLSHGYQRGIYALELARNAREFLRDETDKPQFYNHSLGDLLEAWRMACQ
jgi:hypothetical protein